MAPSLADLTDLIRRRRTNLLVDKSREVPVELVTELCALVQWAPNHKRTWPGRFALFTGDGRQRLGDAFGDDMVDEGYGDPETGDPAKVSKTRGKYLRTPAILVVGSAAHPKANLQRENLHAVARSVRVGRALRPGPVCKEFSIQVAVVPAQNDGAGESVETLGE